ncbi:MAG TPA: DNA mismatch repair endonuclease MutL [Candidatus Eremiobacteraceae bacterium]|nr:DNA mismatch repair endonuclease MutL [Candidatus Eremiobacteraceae bacterium]
MFGTKSPLDVHAVDEIRPLDEATIAQIAAGEVIERPVSVVKELVENSLDAGASSIAVELIDGGRTTIAVTDDGRGIGTGDLSLALARHATSKLRIADDLFAVRTLGFRGEGLASIAAAGRLEIISRRRSDDVGARIEAAGSSAMPAVPAASPPGTKVTVRDLFALVPARREFLKSERAEFARVSAFLSQLSLGWPNVAFVLRNDGRDVWALPAVADPVDRLESVFGRDARGALVAIDGDSALAREKVSGYISAPGRDRPHRNHQVFFVNGRLVRSSALSASWLAAYASFGMTGRFPYGVVRIDLPPEDVDVNVHPTKIEVRFRFGAAVFDAVRAAIARSLRRVEPVRPPPSPMLSALGFTTLEPIPADRELIPSVREPIPFEVASYGSPSQIRIFGQIDQTYIAASDGRDLLIIDQHAAHERIAYEALLAGSGARDIAAPMLFATVVELTPDRAASLHDHREELAAIGVDIEQFGDDAYRIRSLPAGYEKRRFDLAGVLDDLAADDAQREGADHRRRVLATVACHSVVRAHEPLALQEQAALVERLRACDDPHTCPHGRPTMFRLDAPTLARAFKRA